LHNSASSGRSVAEVNWRLGPKISGRSVLVLHSSYKLGELSQWQRHDDSDIDTVVTTTITAC